MNEALAIRPFNKRNAISFTLAGIALLVLAFWLFVGARGLFAPGLVCFTLGAIALILGGSKLAEPEISFELTSDGLLFVHRKGQLGIAWDNIQRVDVVRVTQGMELTELPYVGVRLRQLNPVLDCISPRLATGFVSEQRPLLMTAVGQLDELDTLEQQLSAEFTPLIINGERYRGVLAMFGHRCELLNRALGYHIYLPADSLDRSPEEFVSLLRGYLQPRL
ncbi:DUF2982 domain-containing protein [Shewanella sp. GXUN23E]|uniref:DUF2982 domain-containing protein n=1 Tax=Shewanella sp. GXUN23E TaxID=3422498 RepID=UPI003D7C6A47